MKGVWNRLFDGVGGHTLFPTCIGIIVLLHLSIGLQFGTRTEMHQEAIRDANFKDDTCDFQDSPRQREGNKSPGEWVGGCTQSACADDNTCTLCRM